MLPGTNTSEEEIKEMLYEFKKIKLYLKGLCVSGNGQAFHN